MNFIQAFAEYGATLRNPQWAVSAIANGELVVSCWQHYFERLVYRDHLSRFSGPGNNLLRKHLEEAVTNDLPVRAVVAYAEDTAAIDAGEDASKVKKKFTVKPDWIGRVTRFDGDAFEIAFRIQR